MRNHYNQGHSDGRENEVSLYINQLLPFVEVHAGPARISGSCLVDLPQDPHQLLLVSVCAAGPRHPPSVGANEGGKRACGPPICFPMSASVERSYTQWSWEGIHVSTGNTTSEHTRKIHLLCFCLQRHYNFDFNV
ncbi:hypothetical protein DPMN_161178 [Dreissena polymorpha]|uniref:Uncharacterized protein n=1 Tax=Dreissena polymorpha TaxID=45954 RepID=A0A9D4IQV7_DREPO|nr:hypothetical protein DPMN_161178 [Dreissena polymorpha]